MSNSYSHLIKAVWLWEQAIPVFGCGRDSGGDNQVQSVPEQEKVYREFVATHSLSDQGFFGDAAKVSTKTENRTQLQRLLKIIDQHFPHIDDLYARERLAQPRAVLIVWKFNRLSRDPTYVLIWRCGRLWSWNCQNPR